MTSLEPRAGTSRFVVKGCRHRWSEDELEQLLRTKIDARLQGYTTEGPGLTVMRLFSCGGHATKGITHAQFHATLMDFLNVEISELETKRLFERYDTYHTGALDIADLVQRLAPPPHSNTAPPRKSRKPQAEEDEVPSEPKYVRRCGLRAEPVEVVDQHEGYQEPDLHAFGRRTAPSSIIDHHRGTPLH